MADPPAEHAIGDMTGEELRRHGRAAVDWVADYLDGVAERPVLSTVSPGDIARRLPADPPVRGEPMDRILADLDEVVLPGITHWQHPRFLAYFAITGSGPGILGELVAAGLNVNGMLWRTSPAVTELEQVTLDWLRRMLGLPDHLRGIIMDTASMSTFVALAAARHRRWPSVREEGPAAFEGRRPVLYASEQSHSSVDKAAIALGLGHRAVRQIPTDGEFRLRPDALRDAIDGDLTAGHVPFAVVATVGTTATTSIDPVPAIAEICADRDLWLHVDGAYGGTAAIVPEMRDVLAGAERADSVVVNPHKWLATPIDCSAFYVRDPGTLKAAFALVPDYLATTEEVDNLMDWGVQLGRRFRALKLWFVLRWFGHDGLATMIREHCRLAQVFADRIDGHDRFVRVAPVPLSTVCFRATGAALDADDEDRLNEALVEAVNRSGEAYLSSTVIDDRVTLRVAVGNLRTTEADIVRTLEVLDRELARLSGDV